MNDPYIKGVLTVIAASLVLIVIQNGIRVAKADNDIQKVQVCDAKNCMDLAEFQIGRYGLFTVRAP